MTIRSRTLLAAAVAALTFALVLPLVATAANGDGDLAIGTEQVTEGESVYASSCASCHGPELEGMAHFPQLAGSAFRDSWAGRPVGELHAYVSEQMPLGAGGSLSDEAYAAVVALILERNGIEAGDAPFDPSDEAVLETELTFGD